MTDLLDQNIHEALLEPDTTGRPFCYQANVTHVVDGDTVDVELDLGFGVFTHQRLRLFGIDTPEVRGPSREAGLKATWQLEAWLEDVGREVVVRTLKDRQGKYGRYLAILYTSDHPQSINLRLVREGLARPVDWD